MNIKSIVSTVGSILVLIAAIGLVLWALRYIGLVGFGFGSLTGLLILALVGIVLAYVARRM